MIQSKLPFKSLNNIKLNVWTWNINCIKYKTQLIKILLIKHDIDILLVTETKIMEKDESITFENYTCLFNSNKTSNYHGVAFIYKSTLNMTVIDTVLPHNELNFNLNITRNKDIIQHYLPSIKKDIIKAHYMEGRILVLKCDFNNKQIIFVGTYVPNSGVNKKHPLKRLAYRTLSWDKDLYQYLSLLKNENVIWLGDLNVVIKDNDTHNIKSNIAGTTIEERSNIKEFMIDWIDTWDIVNNVKKCSLRATWGINTRYPLRLDYIICSKSLKKNIVSSYIDQQYEGSDHCPIGTQFFF